MPLPVSDGMVLSAADLDAAPLGEIERDEAAFLGAAFFVVADLEVVDFAIIKCF
jgi:hypothetical protein